MKINQPHYIEPRKDDKHIDLNGEWEFVGVEGTTETPERLTFAHKTRIPLSIYHSLSEAGVLPDPYIGTNSKLYEKVDEKVWYYRKTFTLHRPDFDGNAYLCFDGIAYYARVWLNGKLLGEHEGMFAGPVMDVAKGLNLDGENVVIVEAKACNYGIKDTFDAHNKSGENSQIVPWNLARDSLTSNGDFIVIGIWNTVRLELVEKAHISRPYLYTESLSQNKATLRLEMEVADGQINECRPFFGYNEPVYSHTLANNNGMTGILKPNPFDIGIEIAEKDTGKVVYQHSEPFYVPDYDKSLMNPNYHELAYYAKDIEIENPKLWYPIGLGEPYLYTVRLSLSQDGHICDTQTLDTGIRLIETKPTAGKRYNMRWEKFRFYINGKDFFVKGMNWAPLDFLLKMEPEEYRWCLTLVKEAGIQLLRVWNGGGFPEADYFYKLCDEMGILVWQDHLIANLLDSHNYPQDVLEEQEAYNIYRLRNHPSLAVHCGGNEFDPYSLGNAASMFIIERNVRTLDPARLFHYASPDRGSSHIYKDMEPTWYRHIYHDLPFLAESGIHSFPSFKTLQLLLSEKECTGILPDLSADSFAKDFPQLLNHFTEYAPSRVPRMMARASQIVDVSHTSLENMCLATQTQAYEFYNIMIQAMRDNYPNCGGVMPWLFKRPWATVGIQLVDGYGQPGLAYYAMKNAYKPTSVCLRLDWSVIAPFEPIPLTVTYFHEDDKRLSSPTATVSVYAPDMTVAHKQSYRFQDGETAHTFAPFKPDDRYTDRCFLISVDLSAENKTLSRSTYFIKCTSKLADKDVYKTYRTTASDNLYFENGPWLLSDLQSAKHTTLSLLQAKTAQVNGYTRITLTLRNTGNVDAYPVLFNVTNKYARFYADDNVFLLQKGETKTVTLTVSKLEQGEPVFIEFGAWNTDKTNITR